MRGGGDPMWPGTTPAWVTRLRQAAQSGAQKAPLADVLTLASALSPEPPELAGVDAAARYVVFSLGASRYALPVDTVMEVRPAPRCTPVPNTSDFVRGVAHVRNEVVCVLDLANLLDVAPSGDEGAERILLVKPPGRAQAGALVVDGVLDLASLAETGECTANDIPISRRYLRGACRFGGEVVGVLNVEALLESAAARQWAKSGSR